MTNEERKNPALRISGKELIVRPPKFPANEIKEVLGGKLNKKTREWRLPITAMNVLTLVEWYGDSLLNGAGPLVRDLYYTDWGFSGWGADKQNIRNAATSHPRWEDLYDFQQEAVEYMTSNPHLGGILALDPGLGKAPTSIVAMDTLGIQRALIVAPLTLARNWMTELDNWQRYYRSWSRATRTNKDPQTECVITNHEILFEPYFIDEYGEEVLIEKGWTIVYDKDDNEVELRASPQNMRKWINEGPQVEEKRTGKMIPARKRNVRIRQAYDLDWDLILIDESVLLKNSKAIKVEILMAIAKYAKWVWLLSGSPTAKFNTDLYSQVKMIKPRAFRSYWRFAEFFSVVDKNQWGWKITGDKPDHPPKRYLKDLMFIRSQKEVLEELPDYIYDPIEVDLTAPQQKAFDGMMEEWVAEIDAEMSEYGPTRVTAAIALAQQTRAAQITSNLCNIGGKRSSAKENLLMDLMDNEDIQFPLLIWCWWVPTAQSVYDRIYDDTDLAVDVVTGSMKSEEKDSILHDYKSNNLDVLVLQMGVGKFGHTLTNTRTIFYHDRSLDSDAYFQSLRRVRRITLTHRPRLIVPRSIRSFDPIVELNLAGKLQSIAKLGNKDLKEMLTSLGSGMIPWEMRYEE